MRKALFLLFILFVSFSINAQSPDLTLENGVKSHKEIDAIYATFTKGYRDLNVELVVDLYTEDANYLASGNVMTDGRDKIRENFSGFFDYVKKNGNTMEIKFRILQREVDRKLGYELGIYTINTFKDGKQVQSSQGKFFVVTKRIGKKWYFRFDGYSDLEPPKKT